MYPNSKSWAFARALMSSLAKPAWFGIIFLAFELTCFVLQIYFMGKLISFLQGYEAGDSTDLKSVYLYAMAIGLATLGFG
jgi:hypothetical protein